MATTYLALAFLIVITAISLTSAAGITIDLIHRNTLHSRPSSNSAPSHVDKLYNTFHRSIQRAHQISLVSCAQPSSIAAPVTPIGGEYLVNLSIGTPPNQFLAIVDSGSDLTWTQCNPCIDCFEQELPIFDPAKSTSYAPLTCDSTACVIVNPQGQGCTANSTCMYQTNYGDKSYTIGYLATETLAIGLGPTSTTLLKGFTFGCGHQNHGTFYSPETGLLGLGQGPISLPSQTKPSPSFNGKFAYCLIPFLATSEGESKKSKISFGDDAMISGNDVVSTPVASGQVGTFYYLTLEGVSVGGFRTRTLPFKAENGASVGNIIIDSGTTLTMLPEAIFEGVVADLRAQIKAELVDDPKGVLRVCYEGVFDVPTLTFHFTAADLVLGVSNTFIKVAEGVSCLSMLPAREIAIFGNLAQMNFVVAYDIDAKTVSFKPTDCKTYIP